MMKISKGYLLAIVCALLIGSGITYAIEQTRVVTRVSITKPMSVTVQGTAMFGVRWSDRDLDQEQNIPDVTRINGDVFQGNTVTIVGTMVNNGSTDLWLTWNSVNLPKGLTLTLLTTDANPAIGTAPSPVVWAGSIMIPRSTSYVLTVRCVDDGTLVEGVSVFDLVITAQ